MKTIIPGDKRSKKNRLIGFLSILCSVFIIIMVFISVAELAISLDYGPDAVKALPPIQNICMGVVGLSMIVALIGTYVAAALLLVGGFIILWRPNRQIVSRIGVYVSLASGIGMIIALWLCIPIRMSFGLNVSEAFLGTALFSILPVIYITFPAILLILFKKARTAIT